MQIQQGNRNLQKKKNAPVALPFFTCGTCTGFILTKPLGLRLAPIAESPVKHISFYRTPALAQVTFAIWQPPKLG